MRLASIAGPLLAAACLGAPTAAEMLSFEKDFAEFGKVPNTTAGICAAAADINSFVYLLNHFPDVYADTQLIPDWNGDGLIDYSDQVTSRDKLAFGWEHNGQTRGGIYTLDGGGGGPREIWEATYYWFEDFAPGTSGLRGQVNTSASVDDWAGGAALERTAPGYPSWSFLWSELTAGRDVELGLLSTGVGPGHGVTLAGLAFDDVNGNRTWEPGEPPQRIAFVDPNDVSRLVWADVQVGMGGRLEFQWWYTGYAYYVYRVYSEGPVEVPEPSFAVLICPATIALLFWRLRCHSLGSR